MAISIQAANLGGVPGVRHGFFTRQGGISEGLYASLNCGLGSNDDRARVLENRRRVCAALGGDHEGVVTLYQEHGATALFVDKPVTGDLPKADAIVASTPGLVIAVLTADCAPVLLADPKAGIVAAAHAGWRGAVGGILESAISEMERAGANRSAIVAAVGPCINANAYEVGPEFKAEAMTRDPASEGFFNRATINARAHFDLPGYVASRLARAGVAASLEAARCTYENESAFFSYRRTTHRREGDYGRQISAIVVT